jgi:hypothetical protein
VLREMPYLQNPARLLRRGSGPDRAEKKDYPIMAENKPTSMTPEQTKLARHALGLPNRACRSYRNRYVAGLGTVQEARWNNLVKRGMAERDRDGIAAVGFCLTFAGASASLLASEKLCPEDFPETIPAARRNFMNGS